MNDLGSDVQRLEQPHREVVPEIAPEIAVAEKPVLVAVDFSPESEAALIWACEYAQTFGAPIEILHVVHDPGDAPGTYNSENGDSLEPMHDVAQRKLELFIERVGGENGLSGILEVATPHCVPGLPASTVLRVARTRGARHLVLGRSHRKGLARLFHGSTAHQITGDAFLPVTIVKANG